MFKNFEKLERSLDFIESLESKKLAIDERFTILRKISEMQKYTEFLESKVASYEELIAEAKKGKGRSKISSFDIMSQSKVSNSKIESFDSNMFFDKSASFNYMEGVVESNLSKTRIMNNKNTGLFNINEYGYAIPENEEA